MAVVMQGYMQICISPQTDNHASTPPFYRPDALPAPNQQCQSTEGTVFCIIIIDIWMKSVFGVFVSFDVCCTAVLYWLTVTAFVCGCIS